MEEESDVFEQVENHEGRIQLLEKHQLEQEKINSEIRNQLTTTEMTVLKESGKQQDLSKQLLDHFLSNDKMSRKSYHERKAYSQQQIWKLLLALAGSGGLIYLLVENILGG